MRGVSSMATKNEVPKEMATAMGSELINSPMAPESINSGKKAAMMASVAVSTGTAISVAHRSAASSIGTFLSSKPT